jgi:hypothetical protein
MQFAGLDLGYKLVPTYYRKSDLLLTERACYRELSSWGKGFKKAGRKLEETQLQC